MLLINCRDRMCITYYSYQKVGTFITNRNNHESMNKKISIGLGVFALAIMLGIGVTSAMAADTSSTSAPFISRCGQSIQKGYGMMSDTITKLLGMSQAEIQVERDAGKKLTEIAQEKNVSEETLIDSMSAVRKQNLDEAVKNGNMTEEQANERLEWMKEKIKSGTCSGGMGQGGCNGGCHQ